MRASIGAVVALFALAGGIAGCRSLPLERPLSELTAAGLTPEEARAARTLYTAKCARCHKFYDPAGYPEAECMSDSWSMRPNNQARPSVDCDVPSIASPEGETRKETLPSGVKGVGS